jgi:hypothetical protein
MEISMDSSKKLKVELLYDPPIFLLGIHPKECKLADNTDTSPPTFIAVK